MNVIRAFSPKNTEPFSILEKEQERPPKPSPFPHYLRPCIEDFVILEAWDIIEYYFHPKEAKNYCTIELI